MVGDNRGPKPGQLERVREQLMARHADEQVSYCTCPANGCFDMCVLKAHHKNGVITAVTTDDLINVGSGREDAYTSVERLKQGLYQKRACTRGRGQRYDLYNKNRLLHPYKQTGERGSNNFKQISWNEALDLIADAYMSTREKYGNYSVYCDAAAGFSMDPFGWWLPGGIGGWGTDSYEPSEFADSMVFGTPSPSGDTGVDITTVLDSKLIVLWGFEPAINNTETYYMIRLAKEKGVPIIVIDPRHNFSAESLATQYIPIRPGTDITMMMGMMYVMFEENLTNNEFIEKYCEPKGVAKYRAYIMGNEDGIAKTPEWASRECGVPAETIRQFARLYAKSTPCYFRLVWGAGRALRGKEVTRAAAYLISLAGNLGLDGASGTVCSAGMGQYVPNIPTPDFGDAPFTNFPPVIIEAEQWSKAVINHDKYERGLMTLEEYKGSIGCPKNLEAPNIKMLWQSWQSVRNFAINWQGANERIKAIKMLDHVVYGHWTWNSSTQYSDVVVPYSNWIFEGGYGGQYKGPFFNVLPGSGIGNLMMFNQRIIEAPGEARHSFWVEQQVAKRIGLGDKVKPKLDYDDYEEFNAAYDQCCKEAYEKWAAMPEIAQHNPPEWEEFLKEPIFRIPVDEHMNKFKTMFENDTPLDTPSGKIEFYSEQLDTMDLQAMQFSGGKCFGSGTIPPYAKYRLNPEGYFSAKTNDYPLYMITPHSIYRQHTYQDNNPIFRDEYRNSVWINVADAKARGIKDGDQVMVFNDHGQVIVPAYVTSCIVPGTCSLSFGRYYEPSDVKTDLMPDGICMRGSCNFLVPNEFHDDVQGANLCTGLVEIKSMTYRDNFPVEESVGE